VARCQPDHPMKHKGKVKGVVIGVKCESNKWYVRLTESCQCGNKDDVLVVSQATKLPDGHLEIIE
jgi:hypothetical protein